MIAAIHVLASLLVTLALVPALAHALELPGKRRLEPDEYASVQRIYYPGFTVIGAAEPLAIVAMLTSALLTSAGTGTWLRCFAVLAVGASHTVYWTRVHPTNRRWLRGEQLTTAGSAFFGAGRGGTVDMASFDDVRRRWERGHMTRAILAGVATVAALVALAGPQ